MTIGPVKSDQSSRIAVLGAPIDLGASQRGTLMGPAALRTAGLLTLLEGLGFDVTDHGDLCIAGNPKSPAIAMVKIVACNLGIGCSPFGIAAPTDFIG